MKSPPTAPVRLAVLLSGAVACVLLSALLASCGSARRGVPVQVRFEPHTARLKAGQKVFMQYCNGCHPGGEAGVGLAINNKPLPGWAIRYQVRHGLGVMPAFSEDVISDEKLDALEVYLLALGGHDAGEETAPSR